MIRTLVYSNGKVTEKNLPLSDYQHLEADWYWVDFNAPSMQEAGQLEQMGFHPLAVKDCFHFLQRPKLHYFEGYTFYVLQALDTKTLKPQEIDLFVGEKFIVTFHYQKHEAIDELWDRMKKDTGVQAKGPKFIAYKIMDELVDSYFPIAQELEDRIIALEERSRGKHRRLQALLNEVFAIRSQLLSLLHTIWPMRDLLYRILNSHHLALKDEEHRLYNDIYYHLEKLNSMIESSREMTNDIRDSYLSVYSHRANSIMMTLTVITTIFMPLTFIAGIYGMNFENMPELKWRYGYFMVLTLMGFVAFMMVRWFRKKGWFDRD
ncbi:magnesium/cobalt transporter CorA [Lihuaxuella thermophila]|uniref:Magnesium transport protein CorA n=1 Tax=Lihuaxuella thermophila TaxID=1173111 RepID=A0A1H8GSN4_9BACL|nr:magnesium/cobalt transporter CorA [Lihuaxuella thermophila]SEN46724.1 magnesium transporter [Lihuaxuella thermophila]